MFDFELFFFFAKRLWVVLALSFHTNKICKNQNTESLNLIILVLSINYDNFFYTYDNFVALSASKNIYILEEKMLFQKIYVLLFNLLSRRLCKHNS